MKSRTYIFLTLFFTGIMLAIFSIPVIKIDPFFHYHKPLEQYIYRMDDPWYVNYGIIKHYDYDALITGTSMTANFKASEMDRVFGTENCIKLPFEGASFKEIDDAVEEACEENENLKTVIRSLDLLSLCKNAGYERVSGKPEYMYDDTILNDVEYLFNKEIAIQNAYMYTVIHTTWGKETTFDEYRAWNQYFEFNKEEVLSRYERPEKSDVMKEYSEKEKRMIAGNIAKNVTETAEKYPDVTFYYFYTPYSIVYFDELNQNGELSYYINAMEDATAQILKYDNIKLYSFFDDTDMICDLNNYKDYIHYSAEINSAMLSWMKEGKGLLTEDNYKQHFSDIRRFYTGYDYESIFQ